MKIKYILILLIIKSSYIFSQNTDTETENTATVYFTRASSLGALVNFTYFDGETPIGRFNGPKYLKYKCKPGEHLFWARSENKSFVEANLEAGKIYIIDVKPQMGAIKAGVKLIPVDKRRYKIKKIQKLLAKRKTEIFDEIALKNLKSEMKEVIARGMERYKQIKKNGIKIPKLWAKMTVEKTDLTYQK